MNHINLLKLFVLKRPGFQSQKYGMPKNRWRYWSHCQNTEGKISKLSLSLVTA